MAENEICNSELLFIYDAKRCNPNGDIDDENKPRMDKLNKINLVSDVRLKRYVRDYFEFFKDIDVFITQNAKNSKDRAKQLDKSKSISDCIDVKLFGSVEAQEGKNDHLTGPVQFTWGESLNKVELQRSKTIKNNFSDGTGIGSDYRVVYSVIAFSGSINRKNAENTKLTKKEIDLFNEAMVKSIPLSRTRSKIGQYPRLYLKVDLKDDFTLKDLREYININKKENLTDISEFSLDVSNLIKYFEENKNNIMKINYWVDDNLKINLSESKEIKFVDAIKSISGITTEKIVEMKV